MTLLVGRNIKTIFFDDYTAGTVSVEVACDVIYVSVYAAGGAGSDGTMSYSGAGGGAGGYVENFFYHVADNNNPVTVNMTVGKYGDSVSPDAGDSVVEIVDPLNNVTSITAYGGKGAVANTPGAGGYGLESGSRLQGNSGSAGVLDVSGGSGGYPRYGLQTHEGDDVRPNAGGYGGIGGAVTASGSNGGNGYIIIKYF